MKKGSVFANRKGPMSAGFGTPSNMSSTSSSFFDNSLPHVPPSSLGGPPRNWQATPMSSHRFPPVHHLPTVSSATSLRPLPGQTPTSNYINRVKPNSLQTLVENLNEVIEKSKDSAQLPFVVSILFLVTGRISNSTFASLRTEIRFRRYFDGSRCKS